MDLKGLNVKTVIIQVMKDNDKCLFNLEKKRFFKTLTQRQQKQSRIILKILQHKYYLKLY